MNGKKLTPLVLACIVLVAAMAAGAGETDYQMARSAISSGGTMLSTGGGFEMSSTIGQPQSNVQTGSGFSLDGGFWYGIAAGDCEADGYVDLIDQVQFIDCVTGPDTASDADECRCYDVDLSGTIDLLDFADVQAAFTGS